MSERARGAAERARRERAAARGSRVSIVRTTLGAEENETSLRGAEALELAVKLSRAAWTLAGRSWPLTDRASIPFLFVPRATDA